MTWNLDNLTPVEAIYFRGDIAKAGSFFCHANDPHFDSTESLDNNVFVLPLNPVRIRRDDEQFIFVEPGAAVIHRAGTALRREAVNSRGDQAYWFGIHPSVFEEIIDESPNRIDALKETIPVDLSLQLKLLSLTHSTFKTDPLDVEESILNGFLAITRSRNRDTGNETTRTSTKSRRHAIIERAKEYLTHHFNRKVGLTELAKAVGTSQFHLCRIFQEVTGMRIQQFISRQRCAWIIDQLLHGNPYELTELALSAGFSNHSHMCRVVKAEVGLSPSDIRSL